MDARTDEACVQLPSDIVGGNGLQELAEIVDDLIANDITMVRLRFPARCAVNGQAIGLLVRLASAFRKKDGWVTLMDPGPRLSNRLREMHVDMLFKFDGIVS